MPRQRDEQKVTAIFEAALRLVLRTGFPGLRMADVAREAGIGTGTLYVYFRDKEELINKMFVHYKTEKVKDMHSGADLSQPFFVVFKRMWHNYFRNSLNFPERMFFIESFYRSSWISSETRAATDRLLDPALQLLRDAQAQHLIKELPAEVMLAQLMGATLEMVKYHLDQNLKVSPALEEQYFDMCWSSIRR